MEKAISTFPQNLPHFSPFQLLQLSAINFYTISNLYQQISDFDDDGGGGGGGVGGGKGGGGGDDVGKEGGEKRGGGGVVGEVGASGVCDYYKRPEDKSACGDVIRSKNRTGKSQRVLYHESESDDSFEGDFSEVKRNKRESNPESKVALVLKRFDIVTQLIGKKCVFLINLLFFIYKKNTFKMYK